MILPMLAFCLKVFIWFFCVKDRGTISREKKAQTHNFLFSESKWLHNFILLTLKFLAPFPLVSSLLVTSDCQAQVSALKEKGLVP